MTLVVALFLHSTLIELFLSELTSAALEVARLFIVNLLSGQNFTLFYVGYVTIVLVFILQFILHGCMESVYSSNSNTVFVKLFVAEGPMR